MSRSASLSVVATPDPRLTELERLIEAVDRPAMVEPYDAVAAERAEAALDAFVASVAAIRPPGLADLALLARVAHYWHERFDEGEARRLGTAATLMQTVLDAAGIVPKCYLSPPVSDTERAEIDREAAAVAARRAARREAQEQAQSELDDALQREADLSAALAGLANKPGHAVLLVANSNGGHDSVGVTMPDALQLELVCRERQIVEALIASKRAELVTLMAA
jgi:hypothetical protein